MQTTLLKDSSKYPLWWFLATVFLGFLTAFRPLADMDVHWHLAMGRAYLEQGLWLDQDPISYLPFVRHVDMGAWAGEVLFAWAEETFGLVGVIAVVALVAGACHGLVFHVTWRLTSDLVSSLFAVAVFAAGAVHRWRGRPDVFSILFFVLMAALLSRKPKDRDVVKFGVLALLWINFHPGAIIMPIFAIVSAWRGHKKTRIKQALLAAGAILLTPRGPIELAKLVYHTVTTGILVPEWRPLWQQPFDQFRAEWFLLLTVVVVFLAGRPWRKKATLPVLALLMALRSFRLSYMLFLPAMSAMAAKRTLVQRRVLLGLSVLLIAILPLHNRWNALQKSRELGLSPWSGLYQPSYPVAAANFLETHALRGKLFHPVAWGGYLGSRLAPRNRSAHDGRISEWGHDYATELADFSNSSLRESLRSKLGFEIFVASPGLMSGLELAGNGGRWQAIYADNQAAIYVDTQGENWAFNRKRIAN